MNDNQAALAWWRSLNLNVQVRIHKESRYSHYTFLMFNASTQAIRTVYLEIKKENQK